MTSTATTCTRPGCGHSSDDHRLDDALNLDPTDPDTPFRCTWPVTHEGMGARILCNCPDFVEARP